MSDLSGLCKHGVSRAKSCGDCMGNGLQDIVDAYNEGKLHGGVKDAYARLFGCITELEQENASLQAKIDALMLEYCPDEMTKDQIETWKLSQRKYKDV